jgi:undecaprenyl diphosphate synthase
MKLPEHIAIIMDGNRRWARKHEKTIAEGHEAGAQATAEIVDYCEKLGIKTLTFYTLSTENWRKRAKKEVKGIFDLLIRIIKEKKDEYAHRGIKMAVLGDINAFPERVRKAIEEITKIVIKNETMRVNLALNYGGRDEIVRAVQKIVKEGLKPEEIDEEVVADHLYTNGQKDPDLIIRPGGEQRLSNFLLWQMSYAEIYFTDVLWPDFTTEELDKALAEYSKRQRRYGK